jgi:hypothetical protein
MSRFYFIMFMYLEHFFTNTVKLDKKTSFAIINYIHCIPALYNAYTKNNYMINYTLGYYMFEIVYLLKYHLPVRRSNLPWFVHTFVSFYSFYIVKNKNSNLGSLLITWNIGCRKLLPIL